MFKHVPVHLVAGARSRPGWDVPEWALTAASYTEIANAGHMVMLEAPEAFGTVLVRLIASHQDHESSRPGRDDHAGLP